MKKILIIPALLFVAGFLFTSCGNSGSNESMKEPSSTANNTDTAMQKESKEAGEAEQNENEENEQKETKSKVTPVSMTETVSTEDVKTKTVDNLLAAFKGETTASAKYAAYSKKAEQEGYHQVALLFKAASASEKIHANNHRAVLEESGTTTPAITPEFTVKSTKENLEDAIKGETYEVTTMYPEFLKVANESGNQLALISLNYAYKTEKKHKILYEAALTALQNNTTKLLPSLFYVCSTCGNTYESKAPARCGISMTSNEKFIKISSL